MCCHEGAQAFVKQGRLFADVAEAGLQALADGLAVGSSQALLHATQLIPELQKALFCVGFSCTDGCLQA